MGACGVADLTCQVSEWWCGQSGDNMSPQKRLDMPQCGRGLGPPLARPECTQAARPFSRLLVADHAGGRRFVHAAERIHILAHIEAREE